MKIELDLPEIDAIALAFLAQKSACDAILNKIRAQVQPQMPAKSEKPVEPSAVTPVRRTRKDNGAQAPPATP